MTLEEVLSQNIRLCYKATWDINLDKSIAQQKKEKRNLERAKKFISSSNTIDEKGISK